MGSTNLTMNTPQGEPPVRATGETESMLSTDRQRLVEAEPRVCQHCHCVIDAHPSNISPLAGIDVFDLPDESDARCTHNRVH